MMAPGVLVQAACGGAPRFLVVPALTLRQLKQNRDRLKGILDLVKSGSWASLTDKEIDEVAEAILLSAARNHPTLDRERLIDLLDTNTALFAIAALFGQGKFVTPGPSDEEFLADKNESLDINPLYSSPLQAA